MRATVIASDLKEALAVAEKAVGSGNKLPILAGVLLEATTDGGLVVSGTDMDTRAWRTASARVDEAGGVILPPKVLGNFLDACTESAEVSITVTGTRAKIVCGRDEIKVAGLDAAEVFPAATDFDDPLIDLTISAHVLVDLISSVGHAVAPDDSRPVLAGISFEITDGRLTAAAADGFRLATRWVDLEDAPACALIARGAPLLKAVSLLKSASSARLLVDQRSSHLLIDTEAGCMSVALLEGQFPDWRRWVRKDSPVVVQIERAALLRAMRLVRTITETTTDKGRSHQSTKARLTIGHETVEIRAGGANGDQEAALVLDATLERGDPLVIGVNSQYLYEALGGLQGDRVVLEIAEAMQPILVRPEGDTSQLQVLMPMDVH